MNIIEVAQKSKEWLALRNQYLCASDAPAMLGLSKYKTRAELLREKSTGIVADVDAATQCRFDAGHAAEEAARSIVEQEIGIELFPVTGTAEVEGLQLLASFDGLSFDEFVAWENKLFNQALCASIVNDGDLPATHWPQVEHQLLVMGSGKVYFTVSDGTRENTVGIWYESHPERKHQLIAAWKQFSKDLAAYVPPEVIEKPVADSIMQLPAVVINASGGLSVCNLDTITPQFDTFLANANTNLKTDEDFANGEATAKFSRTTAKTLKMKAKEVVDQIATVSEAVRTLELYAEKFDKLGLLLEKAVKEQKESIKVEIMRNAQHAFLAHVLELDKEVNPIRLTVPAPDFANAMKGQRTIESLHNKVNTALANGKIEADAVALDIRRKLEWFRASSSEHQMLFPDLQHLIGKPTDDFQLAVTSRINGYKQAEQEKAFAEKKRIDAEIEMKLEAGRKRVQAEEEAKARATVEAEARAKQEAIDVEERRKQAQIASQTKPFTTNQHATSGEPWPFKSPPEISPVDMQHAASVRPSDEVIITSIANNFNITFGEACDWVLEIAESMKVAA